MFQKKKKNEWRSDRLHGFKQYVPTFWTIRLHLYFKQGSAEGATAQCNLFFLVHYRSVHLVSLSPFQIVDGYSIFTLDFFFHVYPWQTQLTAFQRTLSFYDQQGQQMAQFRRRRIQMECKHKKNPLKNTECVGANCDPPTRPQSKALWEPMVAERLLGFI